MHACRVLVVALACLCALGFPGVSHAEPYAYVANVFDGSVLVVDTATDQVVATVPVVGLPFGVAVSPDGRRAYVSNFLVFGQPQASLSVIDAETLTEVATIDLGRQPRGVTVSKDGSRLYVPNATSGDVSIVDTEALAEIARVPVGAGATQAVLSPDGEHLFVTIQDEDTLARIDLADLSVTTAPSGSQPSGLAMHPSGELLYVAAESDDAIEVVDPASLAVLRRISVSGPELVVFHPAGDAAYVTSPATGLLTVIDPADHRVTVEVPVGEGVEALSVHPDGERVYLANFLTNELLTFQLRSMSVKGRVATGEFPFSLGDFIGPLPVGGSIDSVSPTIVQCRNLTTHQVVPLPGAPETWDCEAAGLEVEPGDTIRIVTQGVAR